ncbi:MAG: SH3 domain-containing protein [Hormoscilla sp. SP12CHS1]|nr:SH3 domain-containing protein [Hormoscilla sp. SP12CHS1]
MIEYKWPKEIKEEFYLVIAGGILASALGGATLATILHKDPTTIRPAATSNRRETELKPTHAPEAFAEKPATPKEEKLELGRKPIDLDDEVEPGSEFYSFRQELRQGVTERNAYFIRSILPADGISLGFNSPRRIEELGLENPDERFWSLLEKAIANSCAAEASDNYPVDPGTTVWICSNVTKEFYRQYPAPTSASGLDWELNHAIVVGRGVNVRSRPSLNSEVISSLSNEVVKLDRPAAEKQWQEEVEKSREVDPIYGWTPVIIPNGERGYVYNRYVYGPLENRAVFGKVAGEWQLLSMPGGD